jgi:hypothetical protein
MFTSYYIYVIMSFCNRQFFWRVEVDNKSKFFLSNMERFNLLVYRIMSGVFLCV